MTKLLTSFPFPGIHIIADHYSDTITITDDGIFGKVTMKIRNKFVVGSTLTFSNRAELRMFLRMALTAIESEEVKAIPESNIEDFRAAQQHKFNGHEIVKPKKVSVNDHLNFMAKASNVKKEIAQPRVTNLPSGGRLICARCNFTNTYGVSLCTQCGRRL